jgi:hypothetical protein
MRLFVAGLRKLWGRQASWITLLFLIAFTALVYLAAGASAGQPSNAQSRAAIQSLLRFPDAYTLLVGFLVGLGGLLAVIYGAAVAGSEWGWGTLKSAVARGESRAAYMLLTFAAAALLVGIGLLIAFAIGIVLVLIGATLAGVSTSGISDAQAIHDVPNLLLRGWFGLLEQASIGFAVATLTRSQLAGIAIGIGIFFGEQFSTLLLPDVVRYLPFSAASAMLGASRGGGGFGGSPSGTLDPNAAVLVVAAWLVAALVISGLAADRAEING